MRLVVKLDAKPPTIVKPVHFEGLRKIGEPWTLAERYYEQGADEIFYIDIVASLYQRKIILDNIEQTAQKIFVPFAVGGGVCSIEDFSNLFHHGADKVVINTYALKDPIIIDEAAKIFGNQAIVINIEAKKTGAGIWSCFTDCGRISTEKNVVAWAKEVESRGAGEILLQSIDKDGRQRGYDIDLIGLIVDSVRIPVVAASGAGSLDDILAVAKKAKPSGIAVASILHYNKVTINQIKRYLEQHGVEVSK